MSDQLDIVNYATTRDEALEIQDEIYEDTGVKLKLGIAPAIGLPAGKAMYTLGDSPFDTPVGQLKADKEAAGGIGLWTYKPGAPADFVSAVKPPDTTPKPHDVGGPMTQGTAVKPVDVSGAPINAGTGTLADKVRAMEDAWTAVKSDLRGKGIL